MVANRGVLRFYERRVIVGSDSWNLERKLGGYMLDDNDVRGKDRAAVELMKDSTEESVLEKLTSVMGSAGGTRFYKEEGSRALPGKNFMGGEGTPVAAVSH